MLSLEVQVQEDSFVAGDEISLSIHLKPSNDKKLKLLDGSIQFVGRAMFVNEFYDLNRVRAVFGESLSKVKEESRVISTEKGETFIFPFYITRASLLPLESSDIESSEVLNWKGRLQEDLPASFVGLFCSLQHVVKVKICWKCEESGEIGFTRSEAIFKVLRNPKWLDSPESLLGILEDFKFCSHEDLDDIFPDDLVVSDRDSYEMIAERINRVQRCDDADGSEDLNEAFREIVECSRGYDRSITLDLKDDKIGNSKEDDSVSTLITNTTTTLHVRKTCVHPGTQIFLTLNFLSASIDSILIRLECLEVYPPELLLSSMNNNNNNNNSSNKLEWRDVVKEIEVIPGCRDRVDLIVSVPPNLQPTARTIFFDLKWQLTMTFIADSRKFDFSLPIRLIPLKLALYQKP